MPIKWAYGVMTVESRLATLLPRTLQSLRKAGFDKPRLFVDGVKNDSWFVNQGWEYEITTRYPAIRTFGNWVLALAELYIRNGEYDRYVIFQDDFITYPNLRQYLEKCVYTDKDSKTQDKDKNGKVYDLTFNDIKCYWNMYTFPQNLELAQGRMGWYPANQYGRGAVALMFSREAVVTLLTHQHMVDRPKDPSRGWRAVDGGIVTAMKKAGWTEMVHNPSLVQHIGKISSMGNKEHQQANSFRGEEFDCLELLPK